MKAAYPSKLSLVLDFDPDSDFDQRLSGTGTLMNRSLGMTEQEETIDFYRAAGYMQSSIYRESDRLRFTNLETSVASMPKLTPVSQSLVRLELQAAAAAGTVR